MMSDHMPKAEGVFRFLDCLQSFDLQFTSTCRA